MPFVYVFLLTYQWHWYIDINMCVDHAQGDVPLMGKVNFLLGSRPHVMHTRRLHAHLHVFVSNYQ
jgi:hypothetical protein